MRCKLRCFLKQTEKRGVAVAETMACAVYLRRVPSAGGDSGNHEIRKAIPACTRWGACRVGYAGCSGCSGCIYRCYASHKSTDHRCFWCSGSSRCYAAPAAEPYFQVKNYERRNPGGFPKKEGCPGFFACGNYLISMVVVSGFTSGIFGSCKFRTPSL